MNQPTHPIDQTLDLLKKNGGVYRHHATFEPVQCNHYLVVRGAKTGGFALCAVDPTSPYQHLRVLTGVPGLDQVLESAAPLEGSAFCIDPGDDLESAARRYNTQVLNELMHSQSAGLGFSHVFGSVALTRAISKSN